MSSSPQVSREHAGSLPAQVKYNSAETGAPFSERDMGESWKQWEGEVVGGEFPLREYLGGSDRGAVFLTELCGRDVQKAALRLLPASAPGAANQLTRWEDSLGLAHPHLLAVVQAGSCELNGVEFVYVVTEFAEENLGEVLPQRPLTPAEVSEMLPPVLEALGFLHGQGLVHSHLKPANIMATADELKLSSDGVCPAGTRMGGMRAETEYDPPEFAGEELEPASDIWSLGVTLSQALMRRLPTLDAEHGGPVLPQGMPQPFLDIARQCLQLAPEKRCSVAEIEARLQSPQKPPGMPAASPVEPKPVAVPEEPAPARSRARPSVSRRSPYLVPGAAILLAVLVLVGLRMIHLRPPIPAASNHAADAAMPASQPKPAGPAHAKPNPSIAVNGEPLPGVVPRTVAPETPKPRVAPAAPSKPKVVEDSASSGEGADDSGVVHRAYPRVGPSARETIQGHVRVSVRVTVDAAGNVSDASFDSAGPSKYFARLALESAHDWKFAPAAGAPRHWILQFAFGRTDTEIRAVRATR